MTKIELKHIHNFKDRHGKRRTYVRVPEQKALALPGLPGSAQFMDAYQQAIAAAAPRRIGENRTVTGTLDAAVVAYYQDNRFWRSARARATPAA